MYKVSDLETQCNDEGGSLRGSIALAYQLTFGIRQVLKPTRPLTTYLVDGKLTSTRDTVAEAFAMDVAVEAIAGGVNPDVTESFAMDIAMEVVAADDNPGEADLHTLRSCGTFRNKTPKSLSLLQTGHGLDG